MMNKLKKVKVEKVKNNDNELYYVILFGLINN